MLLNYDVLITVMSFSETGDIGRMMRTNRPLYLAGVPYLLEGNVRILSRRRLISFCCFMLRDPAHRFPHLHHLELFVCGHFRTPNAGSLIAGLFEKAQHLECLKLLYPNFLALDERIPRAISALTRLHSVALRGMTDQAQTLLRDIRSPLRALEIGFYSDWADGPADPVPLLVQFKTSLQRLHVTWVDFATSNIQYPNLTTLYVDDCQFAQLEFIYRSFPNLRSLSLWMGQEDDFLEEEEIEGHRELNIRSQDRGHWESLSHLQSSILSLYMLGVRCRVDNLDLKSSYLETAGGDKLSIILSDLRPSSLQLRLQILEFDVSKLGEFLAPAEKKLTSLYLHVDIHGEHYMDISSSLVSFELVY